MKMINFCHQRISEEVSTEGEREEREAVKLELLLRSQQEMHSVVVLPGSSSPFVEHRESPEEYSEGEETVEASARSIKETHFYQALARYFKSFGEHTKHKHQRRRDSHWLQLLPGSHHKKARSLVECSTKLVSKSKH
jgi:hypothetical protein